MRSYLKPTVRFFLVVVAAALLEIVFFCGIYNSLTPLSSESLEHFSIARLIAVVAVCYGFKLLSNTQKAQDYSVVDKAKQKKHRSDD